jgi:4-diphosphocytidyl-2-C-methyl-D-erythritol kinase
MSTRVRSFSKINLGLAVGQVRADGFHELRTVYQTLALHDVVTVRARLSGQTRVTLRANHPGVPRSEVGSAERNTAWKMVSGALERIGVTAEVEISIDKRLPVQGGMGAGSANAAAALLGLERELTSAGVKLLPERERMELAAHVGSDVPLFLLGGTVLGVGRGEDVYPLAEAEGVARLACVVALPEVGVSTAAAFRELDLAGSLTSGRPVDKLKELSHAVATVWNTTVAEHGPSGIAFTNRPEVASGDLSEASKEVKGRAPVLQEDVSGDLAENPLLALVRTGIENDFEEVVFSQHPSLRSTKRDLLGSSGEGALYAALSGSGSALFGLYKSQADARAAQYRVQNNPARAGGMRAILTETLSRREYWKAIFES